MRLPDEPGGSADPVGEGGRTAAARAARSETTGQHELSGGVPAVAVEQGAILHRKKAKQTNKKEGSRMKNLKEAKIGETVRVVKIHGEGAIKRRIMDMGLTKGVEVYIRKVAPLGDPIEVTVRGYELSLRKADAGQIEVE